MFGMAFHPQILARYFGKLHPKWYLVLIYGWAENGLVLYRAPGIILCELPVKLFQLSVIYALGFWAKSTLDLARTIIGAD